MRGRWELSDAHWERVEPVLRPKRRVDGRGRPWRDTRAVLSGVLWILGRGAQWRELPDRYPPFQTCHRRFQQWVRSGKLEKALRLVAADLHDRGKLDLQEAFIDATFASAKKGASQSAPHAELRGQGSSLSAGNSLPLAISVQSASPRKPARRRSPCRKLPRRTPRPAHRYKAYDSDRLDEKLKEEYDIDLIAPHRTRRRQRSQDRRKLRRYKKRWRVERLFAWLQWFRRLVTRYEYHIENFLGFVHLACWWCC